MKKLTLAVSVLVLVLAALTIATAADAPAAPEPKPSPPPGSDAPAAGAGPGSSAAPASQEGRPVHRKERGATGDSKPGESASGNAGPFGSFPTAEAGGPDEPLLVVVREALLAYTEFFPARASAIGLRGAPNNELGNFSKTRIAEYVAACRSSLAKLEKVPAASLTDEGRVQLSSLRAHLLSMIWLLDTTGAPFKDPNFYVDESVGALQVLLDRDMVFRPMRATQLSLRMTKFRSFFATARENLLACPLPQVLRAVSRLRAAAPLFEERLTVELWNSSDPQKTKASRELAVGAWKEVLDFAEWLEKRRANAPEAAPMGEPMWREWIRSREDADLDPAAIVEAASRDMASLKAELRVAAAAIDKAKTPAAVLADIASNRFEPAFAREVANVNIGEVWRYVLRAGIVEVPLEDEVIRVRETPAFRRREFPIRANLPGSFTTLGTDAFLEIGAPDPNWPEPAIISWLESYGRTALPLAIMREVYPGRFAAWMHALNSKNATGRTFSAPTATEGWTLYAEEQTVRGGYKPEDQKLRVAMLADMIRADARLIASVRRHALGAEHADVVSWLEREAYWGRGEANFEASRLLTDPDRACPGLGRLELIALQGAVKAKQGSAFSPRAYHASLLSFGPAPITASWRALAGGAPVPFTSSPRPSALSSPHASSSPHTSSLPSSSSANPSVPSSSSPHLAK